MKQFSIWFEKLHKFTIIIIISVSIGTIISIITITIIIITIIVIDTGLLRYCFHSPFLLLLQLDEKDVINTNYNQIIQEKSGQSVVNYQFCRHLFGCTLKNMLKITRG